MKKALTATLACALLGAGFFTYTSASDSHLGISPPIAVVVQKAPVVSALERGRQAVCELGTPYDGGIGSAVIVGRTKSDVGYHYNAVTVYHVYEVYMKNLESAPDKQATMTFVPDFHEHWVTITVDELKPRTVLPAYDFASFSFDSEEYLPCADVATEADFRAVGAFDPIYAVGAAGPFAPWIKEGLIGSTDNISTSQLQFTNPLPWNQHPDFFFRMTAPIWWGDSGGAVFSKDGKLLGLMNGFAFGSQMAPATHTGACIKMHAMRRLTLKDDFFKTED